MGKSIKLLIIKLYIAIVYYSQQQIQYINILLYTILYIV